jgi:hypothetical protein
MSTPLLVSLSQVKEHLRVDTSDGDADLTLKIRAASRAVIEYIRNGADAFTDSAGDVYEDSNGDAIGIPEDVQIAVIFLVGVLDRNRNGNEAGIFENGYLPPACTSLLAPYRDPPLA